MIGNKYKWNGKILTLYAIYGSQLNFETDQPDMPYYTLDNRLFLKGIAKGEIIKL